MRTLGMALGMAQRATASGARLFEILDREPRIVAAPGAPPLPPGAGRVELRDVSLRYEGAPRDALHDVSLDVAGGPDGRARRRHRLGQDDRWSQLLPRLYDVTAGAVLIDGVDVRDVDAGLAAPRDRGRRRRAVPVQRHASPRTSPTRAPDATARGGRAGGAARAGARLHRAPARRLRHARRRARADAQRRPAPARGDRPRVPGRPADPDPRRRDVERRRVDRAGDQARRCAR